MTLGAVGGSAAGGLVADTALASPAGARVHDGLTDRVAPFAKEAYARVPYEEAMMKASRCFLEDRGSAEEFREERPLAAAQVADCLDLWARDLGELEQAMGLRVAGPEEVQRLLADHSTYAEGLAVPVRRRRVLAHDVGQ